MTRRSGLRRRLAVTFLAVVAVSTATVAAVTFVVAREFRLRNFRADSISEARFSLVVAPSHLDDESFERLAAGYEARGDAAMLAIQDGVVYTSARNLSPADIPPALADLRTGVVSSAEAALRGERALAVASRDSDGITFYFFFSEHETRESIRELFWIVAGSWALVVVAAGAVSWRLTRRTLRPVAEVATTAEAIARGDLGARLPDDVGDELGALATSFNHMADEVERMVGRLEAAAQRERRFTADVAHELRTPLTGMTATAAILRNRLTQLPEPLRRATAVLVKDVERMRDLVLDLLELARLDAEEEPAGVEPLRVLDGVRSVLRAIELRSGSLDVGAVEVTIDPAVTVLADPARLRRILTNLVTNAAIHGAPPIRIAARSSEGLPPTVEIDVVDHGPGIGEPERVFDRFYKSEVSRAAGGTGLGLAISRQHARSQGGDVTAANIPGGGARLTLLLPAAPAEQERGAPAGAPTVDGPVPA